MIKIISSNIAIKMTILHCAHIKIRTYATS